MKEFTVCLSYWTNRSPMKVTIFASDSDAARQIALLKYPNSRIEGPGAVFEKTETGNCIITQ